MESVIGFGSHKMLRVAFNVSNKNANSSKWALNCLFFRSGFDWGLFIERNKKKTFTTPSIVTYTNKPDKTDLCWFFFLSFLLLLAYARWFAFRFSVCFFLHTLQMYWSVWHEPNIKYKRDVANFMRDFSHSYCFFLSQNYYKQIDHIIICAEPFVSVRLFKRCKQETINRLI